MSDVAVPRTLRGSLPHVDPRARRGRVYRAWCRLSVTPLGRLLSRRIGWRVDPYLMRWTRGRIGFGLILPTALLETRGARTGRVRRHPVIYFHDGTRVTVIASKMGDPEHPAWFHNIRADPEVVLGGQPFRAEVIEDEASRARLWALADQIFPPFAGYRRAAARSGRTIPIIQLIPG